MKFNWRSPLDWFVAALLIATIFLVAARAFGQGQASGILYASDFNAWSLPQGNTPTAGMIQWPSAAICQASSNGYSFTAVKVGRPITIVDVNPSQTETVIPIAVTTSGGSCTVTAPMSNIHLSYSVRSGTAGLQEAIDYASVRQGGAVVITTPAWSVAGGVTSTITSATGVTAVSILDERVATLCAYSWNGSAYAADGCSTQGSTITGVTAGTGITGGGSSGNVTVNVDASQIPYLATPNTFTGAITDAAGFLGPVTGNVTGNASGTAATITGNIIESQVTNLATDLAGKVATTTTVNGHALSGNVVVSASDVTTGTLPHAQLPTLLSGDIPSNAANTSGTAANLSGSPSIVVTAAKIGSGVSMTGNQGTGLLVQHSTGAFTSGHCGQYDVNGNIVDSGGACGGGGGGGLPVATANQQIVTTDTGGTGHVLTTANSSYNVVVNGGIDNTGVTDVSASLAAIITGLPASRPPQVYLPSGLYKINSGLNIPCTVSTCNGIHIVGAGRDNTVLQTNCSGNLFGLWLNNTTNSGDNWLGPHIEHLTIQDTSGTGACQSLLRMTQMAEFVINDVKLMNAQGKQYATGTASVTNGSKTVTGAGTTWTSAMVPGIFWVGGFPQEVCTFGSATVVTLCSNWQQGTQAGAGYSLDYNGNALLIDGGFSYIQYGSIRDVFMYGNKIGLYSLAEPSSGGTSRFDVTGRSGWIDGLRIVDSIGVWLGRFSDTYNIHIPINETARGVVIESGHANNVSGDFEENGTDTVVTTCNGGVASKSCIVAFELNSDSYGTGYGNTLVDPYAYNAGVAVQVDSSNVQEFQVLGLRTDGGNTNNFNFMGTLGCPVKGSGVHASIHTFDCEYSSLSTGLVSVSVPSFAVPANTCYGSTGSTTPATFTMTNLTTSMKLSASFTSNPSSIVGWGASGGLNIAAWPSSSNTGSYVICNPTSGSITGGAITFIMGAQ